MSDERAALSGSKPKASGSAGGYLLTDDITKLIPQRSTDVSKTSALEISQTPPIAQDVGIGIGI